MEDAYYALYAINIDLHEARGNYGADEYRDALTAHREAAASFAADLQAYNEAVSAHEELVLAFNAELDEYRTALTDYAAELANFAESLLALRAGEITEVPAAPVMPDFVKPVNPGELTAAPPVVSELPIELSQFAPDGITLLPFSLD
jgi:hypothetical protein